MNRLCLALLMGTSLSAPAFAQTRTSDEDANVVVVTGQRPVNEASAGTKSNTPLAETPQSISVISSNEIVGLGLQNLNQALRYVAGVTPETRGAGAEVYDQFKLRGFDAPIYLDGLKLYDSSTAIGYAAPQIDVSRLDRVEVVKGPASTLYGQSSPGGLVDEQSKLPIDQAFYGAIAGTYGTNDLYRVDADVGGKVGEDVLWRVYGSANGAHDEQTYGSRARQTISAAVTAGAGTSTSFTLLAAYSHDPRNGDYSVDPAIGTFFANPAGTVSTKFYGGEPNDYFSREQFGLTYIFKHDFGHGWALRSSGRYQSVHASLGIVYTGGSPDPSTSATAPTLFSRYSYSVRQQTDDWTFDNQLTGTVDTGPLHHSLLFGADRQVNHSAELSAFGGATSIDVFAPVYGTMPTPATPYLVPGYAGGLSTPAFAYLQTRQQGLYAQDQISAGGLRIMLSGRQDWARTASDTQVQNDKKFTYRVGALYVTPVGIAPYVSYSTSFQPQSTPLADGSLPKPSLGRQLEAGVKYQVPGTQILLTGAWFEIHQTNVAVPNNLFSYYQTGEVRSRGVELEANAALPHGFNTKIAFSRQSVKDIKDVTPANVGLDLLSAGRGGVSAYLDWSPRSGSLQGFTIGGDVRHVDSVYAGIYSVDNLPYRTPAYTLFDALVRYDIERIVPSLRGVTLSVNAANIFDKKYLSSCMVAYSWCWYGNRRTVQGTIGYRF